MSYKFGGIAPLKRNLEIEGKTGADIGLENGTHLIALAASDANPLWRAHQSTIRRELNEMERAKAPAEEQRAYLAARFARLILKGWYHIDPDGVRHEGVPDNDDHTVASYIPFSPEAAEAYLAEVDDAFTVLNAVIWESKNYRGKAITAIVDQAKK